MWRVEAMMEGMASSVSSTGASRAPVHLAMADQPSTQSWRVTWLRDGRARRAARSRDRGRSTRPSTTSR